MDRKQKKALKIIRNLQKKMDKAMHDDNASEVERLSKEMWEAHNRYEITISDDREIRWVSDWGIAGGRDIVIGCDFERKIK